MILSLTQFNVARVSAHNRCKEPSNSKTRIVIRLLLLLGSRLFLYGSRFSRKGSRARVKCALAGPSAESGTSTPEARVG
jgi:hypothetical protein